MNILQKIKRHAAVATGNFGTIFKNTADIPPLPAATARLLAELNDPNPDFIKLERILTSTSGLAAKIIKTVNSSLFSLRNPVADIRHAISLLGIKHIRELAVAYALVETLPVPNNSFFDYEALWTDSLIMALLAKEFAKKCFPSKTEEAFVAALLSDLALPVLLTIWSDYYSPILEEWQQSVKRLSEIERDHFKWDHSQAGAWIVKSWNFSEEIICYIGAHNFSLSELKENELESTLALPIAISSTIGSILKPNQTDINFCMKNAIETFGYSSSELIEKMEDIKLNFNEIRNLFNLSDRKTDQFFSLILQELKKLEEQFEVA